MNAHLIESKVTVQFRIACNLVGYEAADVLFDSMGLNDDDTWEDKDDEAEALVETLLCAESDDAKELLG